MAFCSKNTLFVRNLSPHVSEAILRETFGKCDVVERVLFRSYPGRATEYFAQVDFRTSAGVTEGHKLSGTSILGVTCEVSVMDPGCKAMMKQVWETREQQLLPPGEEAPHPSEPQGVQAEYIRRFKEAAEDKRLRTVHIAGLTEEASEDGLRILCKNFGEVEALRLDSDEEGKIFALVEFKDRNVAYLCKTRQQFLVDGNMLTVSEAKTLVDTKSFAEQSVHFSTPIFDASTMRAVLAYQCHLNPKLAKARAAAAEIMNEPVPPETEAILKKAEEATKEPEPVQWPGRSERDPQQWPWRPATVPQRSSRSRESRERGRERRGERRKRRRTASQSRSGRHRSRPADAEGQRQVAHDEEAIDLDDEDVAMVPNTEMLVLGESCSSSERSQSPTAVEGKLPVEELQQEANGKHDSAEGGTPLPLTVEPDDCVSVAENSPVCSVRDGTASEVDEPVVEATYNQLEVLDAVGAVEEDINAVKEAEGDDNTAKEAEHDVSAEHWECRKCGEVNRASRTHCNNCGAAAPGITEPAPVEEVDEMSTASEPSPSPPLSLADDDASPARSVAESPPSPARSIPGSGSARSVAESDRGHPQSIDGSPIGGLVDLAESGSEKGDRECAWEADRVHGEIADARARIFHEHAI